MSDTFKTKIPGKKNPSRKYKLQAYGIGPGNRRGEGRGEDDYLFPAGDWGVKRTLSERKRIKRRPKKRARQAGKKEISDE